MNARERDVLQLLRDYRSYETPFGGAMPLDESGVIDAAYGPAGLTLSGSEFGKSDRAALGASLKKLRLALRFLREGVPSPENPTDEEKQLGVPDPEAYLVLYRVYILDPADSSVVDHWRGLIEALDAENEAIGKENQRRRKKGKPPRHKKIRHVTIRRHLEQHDRGIEKLALILKRRRLHAVHPKLMSERERVAGAAAEAQIVAYYERVRVAGRTHRGAIAQTAVKFELPEDAIEKRLEFKAEAKLSTCIGGCGRPVFSQNMCQAMYQRNWREKKRRAG